MSKEKSLRLSVGGMFFVSKNVSINSYFKVNLYVFEVKTTEQLYYFKA